MIIQTFVALFNYICIDLRMAELKDCQVQV